VQPAASKKQASDGLLDEASVRRTVLNSATRQVRDCRDKAANAGRNSSSGSSSTISTSSVTAAAALWRAIRHCKYQHTVLLLLLRLLQFPLLNAQQRRPTTVLSD